MRREGNGAALPIPCARRVARNKKAPLKCRFFALRYQAQSRIIRPMFRLIVLALAVAAAIWLIRRALADRLPPEPRAKGPAEKNAELVRCERCGLHLPKSEARVEDGRFFCSAEHARLGAGRD